MRVAPIVFLLAHREDTESCVALFEAAERVCEINGKPLSREDGSSRVSDIWVDGSGGCAKAIRDLSPLADVHRCLEHIKRNIDQESGKKAPGKRTRRLQDPELKKLIKRE